VARALFWLSAAFIAYVYAGYPALLAVWLRLRRFAASARHVRMRRLTASVGRAVQARQANPKGSPHDSQQPHASPDVALPGVTVIVAARNEAPRLRARVANLLASDYPADRLQIIVASDGSTDDPAGALAPYADRVTLLMLPPRAKAAALNAAVMHATHPILVFADARQRFAPDAIRRLVSHFADPAIGAVSGELMLDCEAGLQTRLPRSSTIGEGVGAYWTYEKWIRRHEALVGSTPGVTGAIAAMRRWLWQPLPPDTILDDVLTPMRVVQRGYRVTFDPAARAYDVTAADASTELRRKVRTLAGNVQLVAIDPGLLLPWRNRIWIQFVSHKMARLLVPYALAVLFVASAALCTASPLYAAVFAAQAAFYALAAYGARLDRRGRRTPAAEVAREAA
jgi:cellulose synthase/poly-beta-1,6-N-acetylglucosamine synthase-like glycosyltransferase